MTTTRSSSGSGGERVQQRRLARARPAADQDVLPFLDGVAEPLEHRRRRHRADPHEFVGREAAV